MNYLYRVWRLRHFWLGLVRNDLCACYRRSMIGLGWSLLHPIAMTAVLCAVFSGLFKADVKTFAPFLMSGLVTWNFFVSVMTGGCQCFLQGEPYIRQHPAPILIYPLRTTLGAAIHFFLGLLVVLALTWCFQGLGNLPALLSLLPAFALLFLAGWALAVCVGIINVMFQDTQHLVDILLQILFYMTPVMYYDSLLRERKLGLLLALNPLAGFLDLIRQPILHGAIPAPQTYLIAALTAAVLAGLALLVLWRLERRLIFYL